MRHLWLPGFLNTGYYIGLVYSRLANRLPVEHGLMAEDLAEQRQHDYNSFMQTMIQHMSPTVKNPPSGPVGSYDDSSMCHPLPQDSYWIYAAIYAYVGGCLLLSAQSSPQKKEDVQRQTQCSVGLMLTQHVRPIATMMLHTHSILDSDITHLGHFRDCHHRANLVVMKHAAHLCKLQSLDIRWAIGL